MMCTESDRNTISVAPFAGAWIEIYSGCYEYSRTFVAPFAGAWIEICVPRAVFPLFWVAPFAGAWIEIYLSQH